jgi:hypothetical protein
MAVIADGADIDFFGFWAKTPVAPNKFSNPIPFCKGLLKCYQILLERFRFRHLSIV